MNTDKGNTTMKSRKSVKGGTVINPNPNRKSVQFMPSSLLKIPQEYKSQIRKAFDMFDTEGVGHIKASEVKVALYALGYDVSNSDLANLLKEVGVNGLNESIDYNDFYNVMMHKMTILEPRMESVRAFKLMDEEHKGYIGLEDLRSIANSLQMDLTDDELNEMLLFACPTEGKANAVEFDANDGVKVSEEDFMNLMKRANVY